ncbi:uncharacterized protein C8R40DRAFT_1165285 [Lentinula edodes]|uniref:uncharacterized protein n=1 Tax=Lentinula edodes TaxID=5353 RepID=UPI001E8DAD03|nr:uncharacterized protein C8R40DRAFT_1165285 [Lentinula edodes]KAH7880330.1 hypothetical protein C8R40DRAFT_1165285 [Lentinula edodes]
MVNGKKKSAALSQTAQHTPTKAHVRPQPSPEIIPTPTRQQPSLETTPPPKVPKPTRAEFQAAYRLMGFSKKSLDFMNDRTRDTPSDNENTRVISVSNDSDSELSSATRGFEPTQVQLGRRKYLLDTAGIEDEDSETEDEGEEEIEEQESDDNELLSGRTTITASPLKIRISRKDKTEVVEKQTFIFSVPVDDANEEFTTPISWADFEYAVANTLGIAPRQVRVAYRFSTTPQSDCLFNHVRNEAQLRELIKDAKVAQKAYAKSRVKTKKKFIVVLKRTGEQSEKPGKDKDGKGKVKTLKKRKRSDSSEEEEEEGMKTKVLSQVQWIAKISEDNHCPDHNRICLKSITSHPQLKSADIATWALMNVAGWTSTTTPPPKLKLDFASKRKPAAPAPTTASIPPGYPYHSLMHYGYAAYGAPGFMQPPASPFKHRSHLGRDEMPSSDPIESTEDVTLFPRLEQWLADLDNSPHGLDNHDFASFSPDFLREKYMRISDLDGLTLNELLEICGGMARGTAKKVVKCAARECKVIRKKEKQRLREMEKMPRHYY